MAAPTLVDRRFRVVSLAGMGSFGAVYRAEDGATSRQVALKILDRPKTDFARFEREAELLSSIRHPNVVSYVAHGLTEEGAPYLAMEWLDGCDLAARLARGRLDVREALIVAAHAATGLGAAHALGVIHRDVKPTNVFLVGGKIDDVRVIDFGIARAPRSRLTSEGTVLGTPAYMAPEQARGETLTPAVDVFALGCLLFECLVGEVPFAAPDARATMIKLLSGAAPNLRERRPDASPNVEQLVARLLERDPRDRPASGDDAAREIRVVEATGAGP